MTQLKPMTDEEMISMRWSPKGIGAAILAKRVSMGISQGTLATYCNVDRRTIREWEHGNFPITTARIFNWLFTSNTTTELEQWRARALAAEAAMKDIRAAMGEYRAHVSVSLSELRDERAA